ncbi:MAG: HD domain-containing protein [bacterium]|nr:HD domain-containing protein [bacterium]
MQILSEIAKLLEKYIPRDKEQEMLHIGQVLTFSRLLLQRLKEKNSLSLTEEIVVFTAVIHDIGRYIPIQKRHTEVNLKNILPYINIPFPKKDCVKIIKAVQRHSIASRERPNSFLEKIIFDADNLCVFTPFGIARWYYKAESWGGASFKSATEDLKTLLGQAEQSSFFYLKESRDIFRKYKCSEFIHKIEKQFKLSQPL